MNIKSSKEIDDYFKSNQFNQPEIINLFNKLSMLLSTWFLKKSNLIDYQSISLNYNQFKDCHVLAHIIGN